MKKKWFQRGICAALIAVMTLGLCACGKDDGQGSGSKRGTSQDPSLAKQYVYSCEEFELSDMGGDDFGIQQIIKKDDRIYLLVRVYYYGENYNENDIRIISMKPDGTDVQTTKLQMDTGDNDSFGAGAVMNMRAVSQAVAVPLPDVADLEESDEPEEAVVPIYEYSNYYYFVLSGDQVYGIKNYSKEDYTDQNNPVYESETLICAWGTDGSMLWEKPMTELLSDNKWLNTMYAVKDGSVAIMMGGEKPSFAIMDAEGNLSEPKEIIDEKNVFSNISDTIVRDDGSAYIIYYNESDNYNQYIAPFDMETCAAGEGTKMPGSLSWTGYNSVTAGTGTDLVFTTSQGVFTYNIGDENLTQIMSYVNSDINTDSFFRIVMIDDEHFVAFYYDIQNYDTKGGYFTKVNPEDIPDKAVMVLAAYYVSSAVRQRVVDFNKTSDKYRIVLKEYETYNTGDDYMAGITQLNNDILSGNMPDILVVDSQINTDSYISKGLLADIGKLIEEDEELSQIGFLDNVFEAAKVKDKLYYVIPGCYVETMIGKKSIIGDRSTWTMKEFQEMEASLPEGTNSIGEVTQDRFFYMMMQYCGNDFVDVSTGKCNFDSPEFIAMLEFANTLPKELDYSNWGEDYWMNYQSQYREDRTVLMDAYISSMSDIMQYIYGYFGEDIDNVSLVGFPTDSGKGSVIGLGSTYAISAKSSNIDGAWEFLRYYLTEEYQDDMYQIPTNRNSFKKWIAKGTEKPYYLDQDGKKVEYDNTFYMNGEEIVLPVLTQEEADQVAAFIESVNKLSYYDSDVQNIIIEESAPYFDGQKSAEEVAKIIQSRVQIYVNENR